MSTGGDCGKCGKWFETQSYDDQGYGDCPECKARCSSPTSEPVGGVLERNEALCRLLKLGTPINTLIGAARSADGLKYHDVPQAWIDSMLDHAEKAKEAWDGIVALVEAATPNQVKVSVEKSDAWEILRLLWFFLPEHEPRNPHSKKATDIEHNKRWHKACELYQKYAGQIPPQTDDKQESV